MDYFLLNECIFKKLINENKEFIIKFLESLNIFINDYQLFEINTTSNNMKVDILLFSDNLVINIQLNKVKKSLKRNKVYFDTLKTLLPSYKVIQININLFPAKNNINGIYNYNNQNEYIKFITSKQYTDFETTNPYILNTISFLNKLDLNKYINIIEKETKIKKQIDSLFTD